MDSKICKGRWKGLWFTSRDITVGIEGWLSWLLRFLRDPKDSYDALLRTFFELDLLYKALYQLSCSK